MTNWIDNLLIGIGLLLLAFCIFMMGYSFARQTLRDDAVSVGHAEYFLDSKHEKQWRWKQIPPQ